MQSQLWRTLGCDTKTAGYYIVLYAEMRTQRKSLPGCSCPFKSVVITGFIIITACFLKGQSSWGSNPPVSTHINGLIGLFAHSQNAGLSRTEMLSPQSPSHLNTQEMHDVSAKWSRHDPSFSHPHCCHSSIFFFFPCFFPSYCVISGTDLAKKLQWVYPPGFKWVMCCQPES